MRFSIAFSQYEHTPQQSSSSTNSPVTLHLIFIAPFQSSQRRAVFPRTAMPTGYDAGIVVVFFDLEPETV
jgi:hypothetical protein